MRILLQRVSRGEVRVDDAVVGAVSHGYVLLLGIAPDDDRAIVDRLADKVTTLRLFPDDEGRFDRSLLDVGGGALVVSQFTLYADARKGRRPSFTHAAHPTHAEPLCDAFADALRQRGVAPVATGRFGAMMQVELVNDGPVTLWLDSDELVRP